MVVVKCTSALAVILTLRSTGLLKAELNPTLPFIALLPSPGPAIDEDKLVVETSPLGAWEYDGRGMSVGFFGGGNSLGLVGTAMIRDGRRCICGALAVFWRTALRRLVSHVSI
jgi:hypothetical protein